MRKRRSGFRELRKKLRVGSDSLVGKSHWYWRTTPRLMGPYSHGFSGFARKVGWTLFVWRVQCMEWMRGAVLKPLRKDTVSAKREQKF